MSDSRQLVIIGSGPAGLTAALYTARANLNPLLIEGLEAGGQLMLTTLVENFPGFRDGIMGPDLMGEMRAQAERFGAEIRQGDVTAVDLRKEPFRIVMGSEEIRTRTLIIATGASARLIGLPAERALMGHGVSTCATCDGYFFKGQEIAVVGGGDSAMEEATFLTRFASKVHLVHRRGDLRASKIMQERALANDKIVWRLNNVIDEIRDPAQGQVSSILLRNVVDGERTEVPLSGVFVAIGHRPNTSLFTDQLEMDAHGYILTHDGSRTSVPGVFACGDVQDRVYRQAITAAGSGCMAAIDCERYLEALAQGLPEAVPIEN
ncbi:MAG TPA: thioredoxin-disulfide reductase [Vicinamibacterales bacterium]|jgi:thioredoxin reductase (NADPH)